MVLGPRDRQDLDLVSKLGVSLGEPTARPWLRTARLWARPDGPEVRQRDWGPVPALSTWSL
jgi:hypothetical protein